jgi:A/G-specific adenine glycosylase
MLISSSKFRRHLRAWYEQHGRDLPWRRTRDPYAILVSELMLQQTQVATVLPYYREWLRRFPDVRILAAATESDVLHAWQGLGYYARARNLHAAAKAVMSNHGGNFPDSPEQMRKLPGLGRYTANAVATFAFDRSVPVVEANTARLFARLANLRLRIDSAAGQAQLWSFAATLVPRRNAGIHNSAVMDLGALICTSGQPDCAACPVRGFCAADNPAELPLKKPRTQLKQLTENHSFVATDGRVLLEQSDGRWRGMWMLPRMTKAPPPAARLLHRAHFPFTHHRVTLQVFGATSHSKSAAQRWFPVTELDSIPLPSPHRRALTALLQQQSFGN